MPQYYKLPKNWKGRGRISIRYKPFWRNIPIIKKLPYWVGDKVQFHIHFNKYGKSDPLTRNVIHEIIDNSLIKQHDIESLDTEIKGVPIYTEGNLKFSLGITNYPQKNDPLIITANVQNKDRYWFILIAFILGIIGTIVTGIISGFIDITPLILIKP
ncbi:hypothetical protein [Pelolinea submarina]|uniref:Uncharacterized protein n=1 Tax=Pelolinea submarina TaxID=913107 RepID=A0A3E0AHV2_9CHLR|nr:hypothetical protein [Pelolinea submarina]REG11144.1 hypothetical protein DFR64_1021 [Pelolinea submarina]